MKKVLECIVPVLPYDWFIYSLGVPGYNSCNVISNQQSTIFVHFLSLYLLIKARHVSHHSLTISWDMLWHVVRCWDKIKNNSNLSQHWPPLSTSTSALNKCRENAVTDVVTVWSGPNFSCKFELRKTTIVFASNQHNFLSICFIFFILWKASASMQHYNKLRRKVGNNRFQVKSTLFPIHIFFPFFTKEPASQTMLSFACFLNEKLRKIGNVQSCSSQINTT